VIDRILDPAILGTLIPVLAIVLGGAVALSAIWIRHRERMAMISMGMHPDHPEPEATYEDERPLLDEGEQDELTLDVSPRDRSRRR
jgi:hypothetical protein